MNCRQTARSPGEAASPNALSPTPGSRRFQIVLVEPEIAPNTGNVARLCAVADAHLHLVGPLGFALDDRRLKRAGVDYWDRVTCGHWSGWPQFAASLAPGARLWFIESNGPRRYTEVRFEPGDYLVFGRESTGLPNALLNENLDHWLRLPMFHPDARSLNLSNCVAIVLYEAIRQSGFAGECL